MSKLELEWLSLDDAAKHFGYSPEGLRRRLRQLRERGRVVDLGKPPTGYAVGENRVKGKVAILWPNPRTALVDRDAPVTLLNPKRGKRPRIEK